MNCIHSCLALELWGTSTSLRYAGNNKLELFKCYQVKTFGVAEIDLYLQGLLA